MGGHGGLNILPQKSWNVYNYDNREKVRKDEEAAAKEEQLKREQSRKRDLELRVETLRALKGLPQRNPNPKSTDQLTSTTSGNNDDDDDVDEDEEEKKKASNSGHINLFEGMNDFTLGGRSVAKKKTRGEEEGDRRDNGKKRKRDGDKEEKRKKEKESIRVVTAEDEKYRLGYGVAGKGVQKPWYLSTTSGVVADGGTGEEDSEFRSKEPKKVGKKSIEELRAERTRREKMEKERTRALLLRQKNQSAPRRVNPSRRIWKIGCPEHQYILH